MARATLKAVDLAQPFVEGWRIMPICGGDSGAGLTLGVDPLGGPVLNTGNVSLSISKLNLIVSQRSGLIKPSGLYAIF